MKKYDVIVVGAGPGGGQCARELSEKGWKVLLTEKATGFDVNNYSSAGAPMKIMEDYQLPPSVVASKWNKMSMTSTRRTKTWESPHDLGVIMEFRELRKFLADETEKHGGKLQLGYNYTHHDGNIVTFNSKEQYETKVIVDATGAERNVLFRNKYDKSRAVIATGLEKLVEVDPEDYQKYARGLFVYIGLKWMPQGYSWIFPMEPNRLKIGVGRYFIHDKYVPYENNFQFYLDQMLDETLQTKEVKVLDKHGKTLVYAYGRKDPHYRDNIIAIGDAISMLNPLACEGIRHAMASGRIAAKHIDKYLKGESSSFSEYPKEIKRFIGTKWVLCEKIMNRIYREPNDHNMDLFLEVFSHFSTEEIMDFSFWYKWKVALKFLTKYYTLQLKNKLGKGRVGF